MNKLTFSKRKLTVEVFGEEIQMDYPTVRQFKAYEEKLNDDKAKPFDVMFDFIAELGMDPKIIDELEPSQLTTLIETLQGIKKN